MKGDQYMSAISVLAAVGLLSLAGGCGVLIARLEKKAMEDHKR